VQVVAPRFTWQATVQTFVGSKARWIHDKTAALRERELVATPPRFISGARILFRGRFLGLVVQPAQVSEASLRFANAFHVQVPKCLDGDERERIARCLIMDWLRKRSLEDAHGWIKTYGPRLSVFPTRVRIGNQKTLWGSCSARGVVSLNWRLVAAPKPVFEYVVVHELCHLIERNHGPRFWNLVQSLLPDYKRRRAWLKTHGVTLG
jgi:predicted metal-dependent hydrolase